MFDLYSKIWFPVKNAPIWFVLFCVSAILAFIGPFGTFAALSLPLRFAYWAPVVFSAHLIGKAAGRLIDHQLRWPASPRRDVLQIVVFVAVSSPVIWAYSTIFDESLRSFERVAFLTAHVLGATILVVGLMSLLTKRDNSEQPVRSTYPRLYSRLMPCTAASIERLTVNDHYVDIHLDDGSAQRVLMRLSDAVAEMEGEDGFYTHRSHWVVGRHVKASARENSRDFLMLGSGGKVPVSRTYRENAVTAGYL